MYKKNIVKVVILVLICGVTLSGYAENLPSLTKPAPQKEVRLLINKMQKAVNPNDVIDDLFLSYDMTVNNNITGVKLKTYFAGFSLFRYDFLENEKITTSYLIDCLGEECGYSFEEGKKNKLSKTEIKEEQLDQAIMFSPIDTLKLCSKIELHSKLQKIDNEEFYLLVFSPLEATKASSLRYVYVSKKSFIPSSITTINENGTTSIFAIQEMQTTKNHKRVVPKKIILQNDDKILSLNLTKVDDKADFEDDIFDADNIELELTNIDFEENEIDLD